MEQQTPEQTNLPAPRQTTAVATPGSMQDLNAGILEGIDDLGGGNYVTIDGQALLYKTNNQSVDNADIVVKFGKRFYQWVDESGENKVFHNSDTKLDDRYKLKFEIKWDEQESEDDDLIEYTMTLSTTSTMNFLQYVKDLSKKGLGVGQVVTRITVSRQTSRDGKNRFSRAEFEAFDYETGNPLGVKTKDARNL